jgi:hypothetical protein
MSFRQIRWFRWAKKEKILTFLSFVQAWVACTVPVLFTHHSGSSRYFAKLTYARFKEVLYSRSITVY